MQFRMFQFRYHMEIKGKYTLIKVKLFFIKAVTFPLQICGIKIFPKKTISDLCTSIVRLINQNTITDRVSSTAYSDKIRLKIR